MDKKTIIIIALLIGVIVAGYLFGSGVPNNGPRADQVRSDIRAAGEKQQLAADKLDAIEARSARSAERVNAVERRLETDQNTIKGSAELIAEGKSILAEVRKRPQ